jgi:hypothetical protein
MSTAEVFEVPQPERDLLARLRITDAHASGRPYLEPDDVPRARAWLIRILADSRLLSAHLDLLQHLYGAPFHSPTPRLCRLEGESPVETEVATGFRQNRRLSDDRARAVAEQGPDALNDEEVAALLLNPLGLTDVADLIGFLLPAYWLPHLEEMGRELIEYTGNGSSPGESRKPGIT